MRKRFLAIITCIAMVLTMTPALTAYGGEVQSYNVIVFANGGTINVNDESLDEWFVNLAADQTLDTQGQNFSVEYWTDRNLEGWQVYEWGLVEDEDGSYGDWIPMEDEFYSTDELLAAKLPAQDLKIEAVWEGLHEDYYTDVDFDMFGGELEVSYDVWGPSETKIVDYWWEEMKESDLYNGATVGDQLEESGAEFIGDPFKEGANFEGWLKFFVYTIGDDEYEYELEAETVYTTEQIMAQAVPEDDVLYAAKWSDMDISDYFAEPVSVRISTMEGQVRITTVDGIQPEADTWQEYFSEGDKIGDYIEDIMLITDDENLVFAGWDLWNTEEECVVTREMSMDEILNCVVPEYNIEFVARWEGEDDFSIPDPYINLSMNHGSATINENPEMQDFNVDIPANIKKIGDIIDIDDNSVKYWDGKRAFKGWDLYYIEIVESEGALEFNTIIEEESLTTAELENYDIEEGTSYYIEAVWAGDDNDYMTNVWFRGYGGAWTVSFIEGEGEWNDEYVEYELRETDQTLKNAIAELYGYEFTSDPVIYEEGREDAVFEGWLKYNMETVTVGGIELYETYTLDSAKLYTTAEIMNGKVPHDDVLYAAKWSDLTIDEYDEYGPDPGYIEVEYQYIDADGNFIWKPMSIPVDGKSTYRELLNKMSSRISHMEELGFTGWEYTGTWEDSLMDEVAVGVWLNAKATYEQGGVVTADINYVDSNGERRMLYVPVVFAKGDTYQDIYDAVQDELPTEHSAEYGWTGEWTVIPGEGELGDEIDYSSFGQWLSIYAEYSKYEMELGYTYLTKEGKTKTVVESVMMNAGDSIYDYYMNLTLPEDAQVPEDGYMWAIGGETLPEEPSLYGNYADAALVYDDCKPVFVNRAYVDEKCEPVESYGEVYYVTAAFDHEALLKEQLAAEVKACDNDSYSGFELKGYSYPFTDIYYHENVELPEGFTGTYSAYLQAEYDKTLVLVENSEGEYDEHIVTAGSMYTLPAIDNYHEIEWNISAPFRGGMAQMGGKAVKAESPYVIAERAYNVVVSELTSVSEYIGKSLETVKAEMKAASIAEGLNASRIVIEYMDVELQQAYYDYMTEELLWETVDEYDFPSDGLTLYLPYPEGTSADSHDFVVTHMSSALANTGEVEVLDVTETENGLKVTVTSLSPIAIAYEKAASSESDMFEAEDDVRLAGSNRFSTSAVISQQIIPDNGAEAIVLVNGLDFADALAAGTLAEAVGAPILMVNGTTGDIDASVIAEINRIDSDHNAKIYIIGGQKAVNPKAEKALTGMGYNAANIERVFGGNRYQTAVKVAEKVDADTAFIAYGLNFPDALGGGSAAMQNDGVILFTGKDVLDVDTKAYLQKEGFSKIVILGGTGVISTNVEKELKGICSNVSRVSGKDRFATGVAVAKEFFPETDTIVVATGFSSADALAGGPLASYLGAPIVLVDTINNTVSPELKAYIESAGVEHIAVLGGEKAISPALYNQLTALLK